MSQILLKKKYSFILMICKICQSQYIQPIINPSCQHKYHTQCLQKYIQNKFSQSETDLKCLQQNCFDQLDFNILRQLNQINQQLFYQISFRKYKQSNPQIIYCTTPNCEYVVEFKPPLIKSTHIQKKTKCHCCQKYICICIKNFQCPLCKVLICLSCKESHKGITCRQNQFNKKIDHNLIKLVDFLKQNKTKKCPQCNFWVQKSNGCNHMVCRCKFQFCYNCNGIWNRCKCRGYGEAKVLVQYPKIPVIYKEVVIRELKRAKKQPTQRIALKQTEIKFEFTDRSLKVQNRKNRF